MENELSKLYFKVLEKEVVKFNLYPFELTDKNSQIFAAKGTIIFADQNFSKKGFEKINLNGVKSEMKRNSFWIVEKNYTSFNVLGNKDFENSFIESFYEEIFKIEDQKTKDELCKQSLYFLSFYSVLIGLKNKKEKLDKMVAINLNKINLFDYSDIAKNLTQIDLVKVLKNVLSDDYDDIMIKYFKYNKSLLNSEHFDPKNQYLLAKMLSLFNDFEKTKEYNKEDLFPNDGIHHVGFSINKKALFRMISVEKSSSEIVMASFEDVLKKVFELKMENFKCSGQKELIFLDIYIKDKIEEEEIKKFLKIHIYLTELRYDIKNSGIEDYEKFKNKILNICEQKYLENLNGYLVNLVIYNKNELLFHHLMDNFESEKININFNFDSGEIFKRMISYGGRESPENQMKLKLLSNPKIKDKLNFNLFNHMGIINMIDDEAVFDIVDQNDYFGLSEENKSKVFKEIFEQNIKSLTDKILYNSKNKPKIDDFKEILKKKGLNKELAVKIQKYLLNENLKSVVIENEMKDKKPNKQKI